MKKILKTKFLSLITPARVLYFAIFSVLIIHSLPAGFNADFFAINGDFQNYNVIRHLLAGQSPFRDFIVYLGGGHLFIGATLSLIFGLGKASFVASKIAFSFAAFASLAMFSLLLFRAIFYKESKIIPLVFTFFLLVFLHLNLPFFESHLSITQDFYSGLSESLKTGNSARFFRQLAPAFYILFAFLLRFICSKVPAFKKKFQNLKLGLIFGIPSGAIIFYSNDSGLSTVFCASLLFFLFSILQKPGIKALLKRFAFYALSLALSFVVFGELITFGHIGSYISSTTSTGDYQSWYYLSNSTYYIFQFDTNVFMLFQLVTCVAYFVLIIKKKISSDSLIRYGIPLLLNMSSCLAANLYMLISGNINHGVALSVLYCTIVGELLLLSKKLFYSHSRAATRVKIRKVSHNLIFASLTVFTVHSGLSMINDYIVKEKGAYIEGVGQLTTLASSVLSTDEFLTPDDTIFSTYASALELHRGSLQPSGYDYIIHVLGDTARDNYLQSFNDCDPEYVTTINPVYSGWEYWIRNANFFFYRELYRDYEPIYANNYQIFWHKKKQSLETAYVTENAKIELIPLDKSRTIIRIKAPGVNYGIADVNLNYRVEKDSSIRSLLNHKNFVRIYNTSKIIDNDYNEYYSLPQKPGKYSQIGIQIIDGVGEVTIDSVPEANTSILDLTATIHDIYTDGLFSSIIASSISQNKASELTISTFVNQDSRQILEKAKTITISGHKYPISLTMAKDGEYATIVVHNIKDTVAKEYLGHSYFNIFQLDY